MIDYIQANSDPTSARGVNRLLRTQPPPIASDPTAQERPDHRYRPGIQKRLQGRAHLAVKYDSF